MCKSTAWVSDDFYNFIPVFFLQAPHKSLRMPKSTECKLILWNYSEHRNTLEEQQAPKLDKNAIFIVIAFYIIPVVKQAITFSQLFHFTGIQDMYFGTAGCSRPYYWLSDFNHFYSNVGYLLLGLITLFIARSWRSLDESEFETVSALAWTMILEGLLRGSYHVCPNRYNFQCGKPTS